MAKYLIALHQFFPRFYTGTETLALETAHEMRRCGHSVSILTAEPLLSGDLQPDAPLVKDDEYENIPVRRLIVPIPAHTIERLHRESDESLLTPLYEEIIEQENPDAVYCFHLMRLTGTFVETAIRFGIPVRFVATDFWMLCPTYQLIRHDDRLCRGPNPKDCFACLLAMYTRGMEDPPRKYSLGIAYPGFAALFNRGARQSIRILKRRITRHKRLMQRFDRVFWSNPFLRDLFYENGFQPMDDRILPFPVPEKASALYGMDRPHVKETLEVGFIGTLRPTKGPQVLIAAVKEMEKEIPLRLTLWGAPEYPGYDDELKEMAGADERIIFAGTFPQERFSEVLARCHVIVIPSLWYENTPLTALSVFAAGRILVASDLGGLAAVIRHGENGFLFPAGDFKALAGILKNLAEDPDLFSRVVSQVSLPPRVEVYVSGLLESDSAQDLRNIEAKER